MIAEERKSACNQERHAPGMSVGMRLWFAYCSAVLAIAVIVGTGLVTEWGNWYSSEVSLRQQTEVLMQGHLGLSDTPAKIRHDLAWGGGQVQQVWGLGAALWRLPFEVGARVVGQDAFPDRIAFGAALALMFYVAFVNFLSPPRCRGLGEWIGFVGRHPERIGAIFLVVVSPPFLSLIWTRFSVYEEVQAYSFMAGVGLLGLTLSFFREPRWPVFILVAALAGMAAFVRPTAGIFGVVSMSVLLMRAYALGWPKARLGIGVGLFLFGGVLLFLSNQQRFGSGLEFGHSLNLNHIDSMRFDSRFDYPYRQEPLSVAGRELLTLLFFSETGEEDRWDPGLSETPRWRQLYFPAYGLDYLVPLLVLAGWLGFRCFRYMRGREIVKFGEAEMLAWWCVGCTVPLLLFYLRFPFINSRYFLDFAPGFAAGMLALVYVISGTASGRSGRILRWGLLIGIVGWWGYQAHGLDDLGRRIGVRSTVAYEELMHLWEGEAARFHPVPAAYERTMRMSEFVCAYNGAGWRVGSGTTKAAVTLFVDSPEFLELEVTSASVEALDAGDCDVIQAKVGLEFLKLKGVSEAEEGYSVVFEGPREARYQVGMQVAFLAFASTGERDDKESSFRLMRVRWREHQ